MDPRLQELLDKQAIQEVLLRYGRTQDWLDTPGQNSCFWPDAEIDFGFFRGNGADWVAHVMPHEAEALRRWHMSTAIMIKVDGDHATAECYGIAVGTADIGGGQLQDSMYGGRYLDELERRDGEWRISKRTYILDWAQQFPNSLQAATGDAFPLNILTISEPGHPRYRPL
ncbi:MAG: nuclear transport factor 2 family protein [Pseudomonadales bacterium]